MLGFWIIVTHLVGAYLTSSEYILSRTAISTTFSMVSAVLYMIPFIVFLPATPLSFVAVLIFRFLVLRLGLIDYVIWAKNLLSPKDTRVERVVKEGTLERGNASTSQIISLHSGSLAIHCVIIAIAIIIL